MLKDMLTSNRGTYTKLRTQMTRVDRRNALKIMTAAGLTTAIPLVGESAARERPEIERSNRMDLEIPSSLKAEHEELHEELVRATRAGGKTGEAAQVVAKVLHPHFVKEEQLAMPPLGLLGALAAGQMPPKAEEIVKLTDNLKKELPAMLKEHGNIVVALDALANAAQEENNQAAQQFAEKLKQHAKTEEEVLYPAAILVGEYIKLKLNG
jgi:hypothetical protein